MKTEPEGALAATGGRAYLTFDAIGFVVAAVAVFAIGALFAPNDAGSFAVTERAQPAGGGVFQLTVDVSNAKSWVSIDLGLGRSVATGRAADLRVRRYQIRAPQGAADLGEVPFARAAVAADTLWQQDADVDGELLNPALSKWYSYSYWTHLLSPGAQTWAVRRHDGGVALLQFIGYYCKPEGSGCLTLRYRLED